MARSDEIQQVAYAQIADTLLLIHISSPKIIDHWVLYDLEEISRQTGKSVEQLLASLRKKGDGSNEIN
jgi:hypothetical protein